MDKKLKEEVKLSFLKRLTGRQNPTLKRIIASIIVVIISFFATFFAGFYLNDAMIKPSANVVFHPYVEDSSYLPIMITNGPKKLSDVTLKVRTCHMNSFETFLVPDLIPNQKYPINLRDKDTIYALDKIFKNNDFKCNPLNISVNTQCFIKTYIVNGQIYAPPQKCKKFRCGYCEYELFLESEKFSKNVSNFFLSPIEIKTYDLNIVPNNPINVIEEDMIFYSPIGISIFGPYDRCMIKTNNNYEKCNSLPIIPIINGNITMIIPSANKTFGTLSINITQVK